MDGYRLPWHVGFINEINDGVQRYSVFNICNRDGRHVAWALPEHADLIVRSVNEEGKRDPDYMEQIGAGEEGEL